MKRFLQSVIGLIVIILLAVIVTWLVRVTPNQEEPMKWKSVTPIFNTEVEPNTTSFSIKEQVILEATADITKNTVSSSLPTPTVKAPVDITNLQVTVEKVSLGPYLTFTWSPDGKKVLVSKSFRGHQLQQSQKEGALPIEGLWVKSYDLWVLDWESRNEEQIAKAATNWSWSPDGSAIAYIAPVTDQGREGALYVTSLTDKVPHQIAKADLVQSYDQAIWLPTNEIIYIFEGYIWVVQPDGSNSRQLNDLHLEETKANNVPQFRISPDGKKIAYTRLVDVPGPQNSRITYRYEVWLSDVDGQNSSLVSENATLGEWSPNSAFLAYYTLMEDPEAIAANLVIVDVSAEEKNLVYNAPNAFSSPGNLTWSPQSDILAFREEIPGEKWTYNLLFTNIDGSKQKNFQVLDAISSPNLSMVWSKDGSYLLTITLQSDGQSEAIYKLRLNTTP